MPDALTVEVRARHQDSIKKGYFEDVIYKFIDLSK